VLPRRCQGKDPTGQAILVRVPHGHGSHVNVCGTSRLLLPAFLIGLAVSTYLGNDGYGWIAAA
jgi:hypothetical protein